jgi:hypothetical protein
VLREEVKALLIQWRDNQTKLQPFEAQSFLLKEIVPTSQELSAVAIAGLQALDYLERGERSPDAWASQQFALLEQAQKPKAQLLLMVVPSVRKMVEASSGQIAPPQK